MMRGLVIGKFYPFHKGHAFLIRRAMDQSDEVTVLVCDRSDQIIPAEERGRWIKMAFPDVRVMIIPDIGHDDDSRMWADHTLRTLGFRSDLVFTSEDYGDAYARFMGAKHVLVDRAREAVPISGTKIRSDAYRYWRYLMPGAKARLAKRIVLVGPESTGKTTLVRKLAEHFRTAWVPEYGRFLSEGKSLSGTEWTTGEFEHIADVQNRLEDELSYSANRVLVCDTDSWATGIWHRRYMGKRSGKVDSFAKTRRHDLYLLTTPDVPFVDDGLRDGERIRDDMFHWFRDALDAEQLPYRILSGSYDSRFEAAKKAVESILMNSKGIFVGIPEHTKVCS